VSGNMPVDGGTVRPFEGCHTQSTSSPTAGAYRAGGDCPRRSVTKEALRTRNGLPCSVLAALCALAGCDE
jgi:hypothetical protein